MAIKLQLPNQPLKVCIRAMGVQEPFLYEDNVYVILLAKSSTIILGPYDTSKILIVCLNTGLITSIDPSKLVQPVNVTIKAEHL